MFAALVLIASLLVSATCVRATVGKIHKILGEKVEIRVFSFRRRIIIPIKRLLEERVKFSFSAGVTNRKSPHALAQQQPIIISTRSLKEFARICVYSAGRTT